MKSFSLVCAVVLTVVCVCVLQSTAVPYSEPEPQAEQHQQQMDGEFPQSGHQQWTPASAEETRPEEVLFRSKRQSHLSLCRYCCNCCKNKGCGFCCRF